MARQHFPSVLLAVATAFSFAACSSTSTSVVAPTASKCAVTASASPSSFTATGGSGSVTVSTARDCTWSIGSDANWIAVTGSPDGQGDATVSFTVSSNASPVARTGNIAIAGIQQTVKQAGVPCRYDLSQTSTDVAAAGGTLSIGVTALTGCTWTASSSAGWITVASGAAGNGNGTVTVTVAPNAGDTVRVGQLNVAGQTYTVSQQPASSTGGTGGGTGGTGGGTGGTGGTGSGGTGGTGGTGTGGTGGTTTVQASGSVSDLKGTCPDITFTVSGTTVATSSATTFTGGGCTDIRNKAKVTVTGTAGTTVDINAQIVAIGAR